MQKQIVRNQSGPAFGARMSPARRRFGNASSRTPGLKASGLKAPDLTGRRIRYAPFRHVVRMPPINRNDTGGADPTNSSYKADLAFQRAMRSAVARGLEHPPLIGAVKDRRPLIAPRLFEPVPGSSGCTSPAFECAELVAHGINPCRRADEPKA